MMQTATTTIPLTKVTMGEEEERAVLDVLRSGWLVQGARVAAFEQRVAGYCGARHAVATTNCTTALQLALHQLGLQRGDEVIVPSFTFVASINAILHAGGIPRIVDVEPGTWNIDPMSVEAAINRNTRAIMPVDQFGLAADLHAIHELASRHHLRVVEDAAPSLGAAINDVRVGSISEMTCFSFHPRKTITSAEGGMVLTDNDELATRMRVLRSHGASVSDLARHTSDNVVIESYDEPGFNFRMSDLHAAVGLTQMDRLDGLIAKRRALAEAYDGAFAHLDSLTVVEPQPGFFHTYQSYCIVLTDASPVNREEAMRKLTAAGVTTRRGCGAVHLEPFFVKRFGLARLPVSERLSARSIAIPLYPSMSDGEQHYVVEQVVGMLR
ncbi:MAG TPA: DegT/DnrJ/EryC1/StrS family aminotransferase [Dehalococcoidia bacterium]